MQRDKILEAIDACRPGRDFTRDPELAPLADELWRDPAMQELVRRSQQFDTAATAAFADVPIPAGLAERLLVAVAANAPASTSSEAAPPEVVGANSTAPRVNDVMPRSVAAPAESPIVELPHVESHRVLGRRRWLWRMAFVGASVAAIAAVVVWLRVDGPREPVTRDDLAASVAQSIADLGTQWQAMDSVPPGLLSKSSLLVPPHQWQSIRSPYDRRAVVCDLSRNRGRAYFVVLNRQHDIDVPANVARLSATGGWAMWAWQDTAHVYVLAVDDKQFRLEDFVRPSRDVAAN